MDFSTIDTLFNIALLVLWFRIWTPVDRDIALNPYVAPMGGLADSIIRVLRPALGALPVSAIAAILLTTLIVLRGLVVPSDSMPWVLNMGFQIARSGSRGVAASVAFSAASFGVFVFRLWALSLLLVGPRRRSDGSLPEDAVYFMARPFTDIGAAVRPPVLLLFGMALCCLLGTYGKPEGGGIPVPLVGCALPDWQAGPHALLPVRLAFCALSAGVESLGLFVQVLVWLVMLSWLLRLMAAQDASTRCGEWIALFLGPLRRRPMHVGFFDLTPLVAIVILVLLQILLQSVLIKGFLALS
jgi:uncharacterized protein YggT (Ycf19 family)